MIYRHYSDAWINYCKRLKISLKPLGFKLDYPTMLFAATAFESGLSAEWVLEKVSNYHNSH